MYKANQEALFQATNQGLIGIRNSEIAYYQNVNSAIGTQAALIGGFTYSIFTQNSVNAENYVWGKPCLTVYYIVTASTIAAAVHVVINTMLIQVLGPGLALHGPIGSMARATEGMQTEQDQVVYAFGLMMILFAISTMSAFWVVMDVVAAACSTVLFFCAIRQWYYYGKRVILRFHWDKTVRSLDWAGRNEDQDLDDEPTVEGKIIPMRPLSVKTPNPMHSGHSATEAASAVSGTSPARSTDTKGGFSLRRLFGVTDKEIADTEQDARRYKTEEMATRELTNSREIAHEGYLTKRGISRSELIKDPWERRYFVMNFRGQISYYKTRQEYREDPTRRIKGRPIELEEYWVEVKNSLDMDDSASTLSYHTTASSVRSGTGLSFQMTLVPKEDDLRQWILKCDTEEHLNTWLEKMRLVCPDSFRGPATPASAMALSTTDSA